MGNKFETGYWLWLLGMSLFTYICGVFVMALNPDLQSKQTTMLALASLPIIIAFNFWFWFPETNNSQLDEEVKKNGHE